MKNKVYPVKYAKKSSISPFLKSHIESFPNAGPHWYASCLGGVKPA